VTAAVCKGLCRGGEKKGLTTPTKAEKSHGPRTERRHLEVHPPQRTIYGWGTSGPERFSTVRKSGMNLQKGGNGAGGRGIPRLVPAPRMEGPEQSSTEARGRQPSRPKPLRHKRTTQKKAKTSRSRFFKKVSRGGKVESAKAVNKKKGGRNFVKSKRADHTGTSPADDPR